jgi:hypothetical protein
MAQPLDFGTQNMIFRNHLCCRNAIKMVAQPFDLIGGFIASIEVFLADETCTVDAALPNATIEDAQSLHQICHSRPISDSP